MTRAPSSPLISLARNTISCPPLAFIPGFRNQISLALLLDLFLLVLMKYIIPAKDYLAFLDSGFQAFV